MFECSTCKYQLLVPTNKPCCDCSRAHSLRYEPKDDDAE